MIYDYYDIKSVHLEVTSKCNASCPMCARNVLGGKTNPQLPLSELTLDDCKKMFPVDFVKRLNRMFMCGNFGDPIVAKDTLDIFRWFRDINPDIRLSMNTNASARDEKWWQKAAEIFCGPGDDVKFSVDGLSDTNHIYRRGTNFEKIIKNASSFIENGGNAVWEFIIFEHNEHQVDEARKFAHELGFKKFQPKKTGRFFSNTQLKGKNAQEVYDKNGNFEYYIYKPSSNDKKNESLKSENNLISKYGSMENYLDNTKISCKAKNEKSIYVSSDGLVLPCCWTANQLYVWWIPEKSSPIWKLINKTGGVEKINSKENNLKDIIEGPFFKSIESSWQKDSVKQGKLKVCAQKCGHEFDQFKQQYV